MILIHGITKDGIAEPETTASGIVQKLLKLAEGHSLPDRLNGLANHPAAHGIFYRLIQASYRHFISTMYPPGNSTPNGLASILPLQE